mgnify:CR=1 FL=1
MKNLIYLFSAIVVTIALVSFTADGIYPEDTSDRAITIYEADYIETISNNDALFEAIEFKYPNLIEKINRVDVQYSESSGHYYNAFGSLNGKKTLISISISKEEFTNQSIRLDRTMDYSSMDNCYRPIDPSVSLCRSECYYYTFAFCADPMMLCGVWDGNVCQDL